MNPNRRRKKRPNYGIRTVEVMRGLNGFGFTISGQQPCILSCIVNNSPADQAGLRPGDFLISVNGVSVSKMAHDAVVNLIGNWVGPIKMTIAENYYSDSSDEELDCGRMVNSRKPKYMHKSRTNRLYKSDGRRHVLEANHNKPRECQLDIDVVPNVYNEQSPNESLNVSNPVPMEDEGGPIEYKALVGYLGTIEMPKELLPNSRLETVCSCIRKLRQEKRNPTAVVMTILPTCLTLKNAANHILAIYPTNRVVYIGSATDRDSRYFGLVTSAMCDTRGNDNLQKRYGEVNIWQYENKKSPSVVDNDITISNSCHVFVTDSKIVDHNLHAKKAESFNIACTKDLITGNCLEFPRNALYIVSLVQNMYKLQNNDYICNSNKPDELNLGPLVANSPQPSASSNSDSGIGFRDDCGNISDRILVVEFPMHRPLPVLNIHNRPVGIDASNMPLEGIDLPLNNDNATNYELNNVRSHNLILDRQNNLSKADSPIDKNNDMKQFNNLNNIRACEGVNIRNHIEKSDNFNNKNEYSIKQNNDAELHYACDYNKLTCRAILDPSRKNRCLSPLSIVSSDDNTRTADVDTGDIYSERPVDVDTSPSKKSYESVSLHSELDYKSSIDNVSMHSSKSIEFSNLLNVFKAPSAKFFESKKAKRQLKMNSIDSLDRYNENIMNYKLSPKVYGMSKPNYSCEELNNLDSVEKFSYGSLQELSSWNSQETSRRNIAQSEPDVRTPRSGNSMFDHNGLAKCNNPEGPEAWATSFEKLLEDQLGLHTFADFLKKEFSAENIYFWAACERYRQLPQGTLRKTEAERIYKQHVCIGAPEPVNVDAQARQKTESSLQDPDESLFDHAQKQILNLMKFDSYPRFLKSDIYKQCLSGGIIKLQMDAGLCIHYAVGGTPSKLKKSLSNAEDRRRKSLLPWHRKNRSKSKDRGEIEYIHRKDLMASTDTLHKEINKSDIHSSKSSLTSLDLAVTSVQDGSKCKLSQEGRSALCRVKLSNGYTTIVQIKEPESIAQLVNRLLEKRGIVYASFEVTTNKHPKSLDVNETALKLAGCEVEIEERVVFKLDLPNKKIISVKSKYTKIIVDVLRPILYKYNYNLDQVKVCNNGEIIDLHQCVTSINGSRLNIQLKDKRNDIKERINQPTNQSIQGKKLEEITNQVFEDILQVKAESVLLKPCKSDRGSVKSEDWGSEHSSGLFGKFLRRDSGLQDKKKKTLVSRSKGNSNNSSSEDVRDQNPTKKPLIAKWKPGANKLQVSCCEKDELLEGLTKAHRRLEDQRGTEINCELPDFLKDKENEQQKLNKPFRQASDHSSSRFYISDPNLPTKNDRTKNLKTETGSSNYENREIFLKNNSADKNKFLSKTNNINSPEKCPPEDISKSNQGTPRKNMDNSIPEAKSVMVNNNSTPPPLPPKPKIIPIKPPNWGAHNGIIKRESSANEKTNQLYLEQPTSSFV